jgi:hypothetical protein
MIDVLGENLLQVALSCDEDPVGAFAADATHPPHPQETREQESRRLATENNKWLRDQRVKAYADLSIAGEETLQFIRSELPNLIGMADPERLQAAENRWYERRISEPLAIAF